MDSSPWTYLKICTWLYFGETPLESTGVQSPVESSGVHMDYGGDSKVLPIESEIHLSDESSVWSRKGVRRKVREWQQLTDWVN